MPTRSDLLPRAGAPRSVFSNYGAEPDQAPEGGLADDRSLEGQPDQWAGDAVPEASCAGGQDPDATSQTAVARSFLYRFLAKAYEDPAPAAWEWLCARDTHTALRAMLEYLDLREPARLAATAEALLACLSPARFEEFADDYVTAFGHAARGRCPLNEIEYGDIKADPLFQPHRLADLAAFYRAFGLAVTPDATERQDHLCVELEFMAVLAAKEAYALKNRLDEEASQVCRQTQRKFLREHLARWTPAFARRLGRLVGEGALGRLAALTREFIESECQHFGLASGSEDLLLRPVDQAAESLCTSCGMRGSDKMSDE